MIHLIEIGFGLLILGLNLTIIWFALNTTGDNEPEVLRKLKVGSAIVFILGVMIISLGVVNLITKSVEESRQILNAGAAVSLLGIAAWIRAIGHKKRRVIIGGALIVTGMGIGFVLSYVIMVFWLNSAC
jgi:hypothetical protein